MWYVLPLKFVLSSLFLFLFFGILYQATDKKIEWYVNAGAIGLIGFLVSIIWLIFSYGG